MMMRNQRIELRNGDVIKVTYTMGEEELRIHFVGDKDDSYDELIYVHHTEVMQSLYNWIEDYLRP